MTPSYICFILYLLVTKLNTSGNFNLLPSLLNTLLPVLNLSYDCVTLYSFNIINVSVNSVALDSINFFFSNNNLTITLVIITFTSVFALIINSFFFTNKFYTLFNFLINLY